MRILVSILLLSLAACGRSTPGQPSPAPELAVATKPQGSAQATVEARAALLRPLIDPAKLATLKGDRAANPRVLKAVAILFTARADGLVPAAVSEAALPESWRGTAKGSMTTEALLENLRILDEAGAVTPADLEALRHGNCPTIRTGPNAGGILSVDHTVPKKVCPELENVIANLRLMALKENKSKNDRIGPAEVALAKRLHRAGLVSDDGMRAVVDKAVSR